MILNQSFDSMTSSTTSTTTWTTATTPITTNAPSSKMAGTVVYNPSTTTVISVKTVGFVTTITDSTPPPFTLPPPPPSSITLQVDTPPTTVIGTYQPTVTLTETSYGGTYYFQNPQSSIYSTSTIDFAFPATQTAVAGNTDDSLDSWSAGAKAGLIIGVVFAALLILLLLICCYKRNSRWIAHDWRWAPQVEGSAPAMANANMMPPGSVASPMTVVSTPSYSYSYPAYTYMRGGGGGSWYSVLIEKFRAWKKSKKDGGLEAEPSTPIRVLRKMRDQRDKRKQVV